MPIITISRGVKSGGIALANALAKRLGYACLSREIIVESARKYNIEEETLWAEMSRPPSLWQRLTRERQRYLIFVRCALLDAAKNDNLVYHGHAGQVFLEGIRHVLKVRIEAPLEDRVRALMEEQQLEREAATERIKREDEERRRWVRFLFDKEWVDPALYDLTLNLATMGLETACDIVCYAVTRPDFQPTEETILKLHDRSLECEVMAGLSADNDLWDRGLAVEAYNGSVVVHGQVRSKVHRDAVADIVSKVKGVRSFELYVGLASDPPLDGLNWRD